MVIGGSIFLLGNLSLTPCFKSKNCIHIRNIKAKVASFGQEWKILLNWFGPKLIEPYFTWGLAYLWILFSCLQFEWTWAVQQTKEIK